MASVVFPGSFDPPTNGHLDIIKRASKLFDSVDVVIAVNVEKQYMFSQDERFAMMSELVKPYENVSVNMCSGLIVDYAKKTGANVLLRGIRNASDCAYEFDLALMNHTLNPDVETIFIPTDQKNSIVKSSAIKELAKFGGNISGMVPSIVEEAIRQKLK